MPLDASVLRSSFPRHQAHPPALSSLRPSAAAATEHPISEGSNSASTISYQAGLNPELKTRHQRSKEPTTFAPAHHNDRHHNYHILHVTRTQRRGGEGGSIILHTYPQRHQVIIYYSTNTHSRKIHKMSTLQHIVCHFPYHGYRYILTRQSPNLSLRNSNPTAPKTKLTVIHPPFLLSSFLLNHHITTSHHHPHHLTSHHITTTSPPHRIESNPHKNRTSPFFTPPPSDVKKSQREIPQPHSTEEERKEKKRKETMRS